MARNRPKPRKPKKLPLIEMPEDKEAAVKPDEIATVAADEAVPMVRRRWDKVAAMIDWRIVQRMAEEQCTAEQISACIGCSVESVWEHFGHILQTGKDIGRRRLIAAMWHKALIEKDTKMMIWLSKQHLGYKETMSDMAQQVNFIINVNEVPK